MVERSIADPVDTPRSGAGQVGKYQLLHRLAVGGMAEIFIARATGIEGFEKLVVLKRILPQYESDWRFVRMFLQEARLAATLQHPNIIQVYDIGRVKRSYFFAMEYLHGVDVGRLQRRVVERGDRLPLEHAIAIVTGVAAGLHYAHEKKSADGEPLGIVHRDVSPSNVLVGYDGSVKLVDFGIAKVASQRQETRPGTLKGKVAYMSPEQCRGEPLDRRSDVFALGVLLFELTTGRPLFKREGDLAILKQITEQDAPPPSSTAADCPAALDAICLRALCRDREQRYPSAQALQLGLESFAFEQRVHVSPVALASYLANLFREDLDAWRQAERTGSSLADFYTETFGGHAEPDDELDRAEMTPVDTLLASEGKPDVARRRGRPMARWILAAITLVASLVSAAAWLERPSTPPVIVVQPPTPPASPVPPPPAVERAPPTAPPVTAEPAVVHLWLVDKPVDAKVFLDGKPVADNPISVRRDDVQRRLVVSRRGYRPQRVEVVPTQDLEIPVALDRIPRRATTARVPSSKPRPTKGNSLLIGPGDL